MRGEDLPAGGVSPGAAGEDRHDHSAGPSKMPVVPVVDDPAIVAAVERASDLDRAWFKRHPDRAHRVRRPVLGEFPFDLVDFGPRAWPLFVIVRQAAVGARVKTAARMTRSPCGCERCSSGLWDRVTSQQMKKIALDISAAMLGQRG